MVTGAVTAAAPAEVRVTVAGAEVPVRRNGDRFTAEALLPPDAHAVPHTEWRGPYGSLVVVTAVDATGAAAGEVVSVGGV
jgi:amidase